MHKITATIEEDARSGVPHADARRAGAGGIRECWRFSSVDTGKSAAQHEPCNTEDHDHEKRKEEVVGHGVVPARGVFQVLADPQQQDGGDDAELAGNDQQGVSQVAPFVQCLDLVG